MEANVLINNTKKVAEVIDVCSVCGDCPCQYIINQTYYCWSRGFLRMSCYLPNPVSLNLNEIILSVVLFVMAIIVLIVLITNIMV